MDWTCEHWWAVLHGNADLGQSWRQLSVTWKLPGAKVYTICIKFVPRHIGKKIWKRKFPYYRHAKNDCTLIWEKVGYKTLITANHDLWIWEALQAECSWVANGPGSHAEDRCGWGQCCFKLPKATWDRPIWYGSSNFSCSRPLEALIGRKWKFKSGHE